jgi:hypothetical protein
MYSIEPKDWTYYSIILLATCSILAIGYAGLLIWLNKKPNVSFAKTLTLCMMCFNILIVVRYLIGKGLSQSYCADGA